MPVDVDAVLFWKIVDPKKAALDVTDYHTMQLGGLAGLTALTMGIGQDRRTEKEGELKGSNGDNKMVSV